MKNIDFLPPHYRERRQQRWAYAWEIAVVAFFGLLIAIATCWQLNQRWRVGKQLAALAGRYQEAQATQAAQQQLQTKLAEASEAAELYLYLEHPWPRTQVLHAIESCLPDDMSLTDVHFNYEASSTAATLDEAELAKLSPAKRSLARLRREADQRVALVWIAGTTTNSADIYEFAQRLGRLPPLAAVKLETAENQAGKSQLQQTSFRLRGVLKPGYGQPGGPEKPLAEHRS
jgi:hypothetical protein